MLESQNTNNVVVEDQPDTNVVTTKGALPIQRPVKLADIILSPDIQARESTDEKLVDEYAGDLTAGAVFPAVTIFADKDALYLADGFHRVKAAEKAGLKEILADIRTGSMRDAILFAAGSNAQHGARRTNEDKRHAVRKLLTDKEWAKWTDTTIAQACKVSPPLVGKIRKELTPIGSNPPVIRKTKSGRKVNTQSMGRKKQSAPTVQAPLLTDFSGTVKPKPVFDPVAEILGDMLLHESTPDPMSHAQDVSDPLKAENEKLRQANAELQGEIDALKAKNVELEAKNQALEEELANLKAENETLQDAVKKAGSIVPLHEAFEPGPVNSEVQSTES